jgi:hypothetical protein
MPPIARPAFSRTNPERWTATQIFALGEFVGSARWITMPLGHPARGEDSAPARPTTGAKENFSAAAEASNATDAAEAQDGEAAGSDSELGAVLDAIDHDVQVSEAAACAGIMAEFAGRIAYARKHLPRDQVAAAIAAIVQARKAALATVKRNAAERRAGRKKAAAMARRRSRVTKGARTPLNHMPRGGLTR